MSNALILSILNGGAGLTVQCAGAIGYGVTAGAAGAAAGAVIGAVAGLATGPGATVSIASFAAGGFTIFAPLGAQTGWEKTQKYAQPFYDEANRQFETASLEIRSIADEAQQLIRRFTNY